MKLNKLIALPLLSIALTIGGCKQGYYDADGSYHEQKNSYQLTVDTFCNAGHCKGLPTSKSYLEGTKFSFKIEIVLDAEFHPYLDGEQLSPVKEKDYYKFYEFRMPSKDSILQIDDNFLTGKDYSLLDLHLLNNDFTQEEIKCVEVSTAGHVQSWNETRYSEDPRDIEYNYSILSLKQLRKTDVISLDSAPIYTVKFKLTKDPDSYRRYRFENNVVRTKEFNSHYFAFNKDAKLPKIQYPSNI